MPNFRNFYDNIKAIQVADGKSAINNATYYPLSGSFIDTSGFDRVCFLFGFADVVAPDFSVYQAATVSGSPKALTGAAKTDIVTADDNKWFSIEFGTSQLDTANGYRFVTVLTANVTTEYANIWCFLWRGHDAPVTQSTSYYADVDLGG